MKSAVQAVAIFALLSLTMSGCSNGGSSEPAPEQPQCDSDEHYDSTLEECMPDEEESDEPSASPSEEETPTLSDNTQIDQQSYQASANQAGAVDYTATTDYLNAMIGHIDTIWSNWFRGEGYPEPWVGYTVIQQGQTYTSACTVAGVTTFAFDFPNAFFCPRDMNQEDRGYLVIPVGTMAEMWTGDIFNKQVEDLRFTGDFAAAMILAHEFGHHIQDELTEISGKAGPPNPGVELIADCFAGIWAYSMSLDGYLEQGDIDEALHALAVIGDSQGSHGTGAERNNAFAIGLYGSQTDPRPGVPQNCITAYWPSFNT